MNYKKAYTKKNPYFAAIPKFINLYKVMTIQIEETHLRNNFRASHLYREFLSASLPGVDPKILDPRDTYADKAEWDKKAADLASRFVKNFVKYESNEAGKALVKAGPEVDNL